MQVPKPWLKPYFEKLRELDFVRKLDFKSVAQVNDIGVDGKLTIKTPKGSFAFSLARKNSYLDGALLNAFIIQSKHHAVKEQPLLVLARYIPRPSAERLVSAGVNFLDRTGNMHLGLGENYVRTVIGNREERSVTDEKSMTPSKVQFLFTLAATQGKEPWTVRNLALLSGLSKSTISKLWQQLVSQGFLLQRNKIWTLKSGSDVEVQLVMGYEQILRPKLLFNRFRPAEWSPVTGFEKLMPLLEKNSIRWSLTGGAAAFELQKYYRGPELVLFVESPSEGMARRLRLMPDREGPVTFLRSFGKVCFWEREARPTVAHPWLIYAELMRSSDSRAHEAAAELKSELLLS